MSSFSPLASSKGKRPSQSIARGGTESKVRAIRGGLSNNDIVLGVGSGTAPLSRGRKIRGGPLDTHLDLASSPTTSSPSSSSPPSPASSSSLLLFNDRDREKTPYIAIRESEGRDRNSSISSSSSSCSGGGENRKILPRDNASRFFEYEIAHDSDRVDRYRSSIVRGGLDDIDDGEGEREEVKAFDTRGGERENEKLAKFGEEGGGEEEDDEEDDEEEEEEEEKGDKNDDLLTAQEREFLRSVSRNQTQDVESHLLRGEYDIHPYFHIHMLSNYISTFHAFPLF